MRRCRRYTQVEKYSRERISKEQCREIISRDRDAIGSSTSKYGNQWSEDRSGSSETDFCSSHSKDE